MNLLVEECSSGGFGSYKETNLQRTVLKYSSCPIAGNGLVVESLRDLAQGGGRRAKGKTKDKRPKIKEGEFCFHGKWYNGAIPPSLRLRRTKGAMVQWYNGTAVQRCKGATVKGCDGVMVFILPEYTVFL